MTENILDAPDAIRHGRWKMGQSFAAKAGLVMGFVDLTLALFLVIFFHVKPFAEPVFIIVSLVIIFLIAASLVAIKILRHIESKMGPVRLWAILEARGDVSDADL